VLIERGLGADHTTVWRWVQRYGPELERRHLKPTNKSWRVDETRSIVLPTASAPNSPVQGLLGGQVGLARRDEIDQSRTVK
jgi:hypothetical protein